MGEVEGVGASTPSDIVATNTGKPPAKCKACVKILQPWLIVLAVKLVFFLHGN